MRYLGALISTTGGYNAEICARLGMAKQEFLAMERIWKHTNITSRRKNELYQSCVLSKLLYGLQSIWLTKAQRCKLDGFHCRCLRRIFRIPSSYESRIPNCEVLNTANSIPLQHKLLKLQLQYYGNIMRNQRHPGRNLVFRPGTAEVQVCADRRRGRPTLSWASELNKHAAQFSSDIFHDCLSRNQWRNSVNEYCHLLAI